MAVGAEPGSTWVSVFRVGTGCCRLGDVDARIGLATGSSSVFSLVAKDGNG
jgi:hypothetical protein